MPLRRLTETPLFSLAGPMPPGAADPSSPSAPSNPGATGSPATPGSSAAPSRSGLSHPLAAMMAPLPRAPVEAPRPPQLPAAASELAKAAARTEQCAREILARAMTLSDQLAMNLERTERRLAAGGLSLLLSATLLCAASAVVSTLVTLAAVHPQVSVLDLLRILLRRG